MRGEVLMNWGRGKGARAGEHIHGSKKWCGRVSVAPLLEVVDFGFTAMAQRHSEFAPPRQRTGCSHIHFINVAIERHIRYN